MENENLSDRERERERERKKNWLERRRITICTAKLNVFDQNAINLTNIELYDACKSLLSKGPSFVPTPYDINWYNFFFIWDSFHARLNSHFKGLSYKKKSTKKITEYRKSV